MANIPNPKIVAAPSLGPDGWIFPGLKQLDQLMAWYLASDNSQDTILQGRVSSYAWVISTYQNYDAESLIEQVRLSLTRYFGAHYDNFTVEAWDASPDTNSAKLYLAIFVEVVTPDGQALNITRTTEVEGSKFTIMRNLTNGESE